MMRDRRVELTFPDFRQPTDPADRSKLGNQVQLRPVEMRDTLRYEIVLSRRNVPPIQNEGLAPERTQSPDGHAP